MGDGGHRCRTRFSTRGFCWRWSLLGTVICFALAATCLGSGFLEDELPLTIEVTTPTRLIKEDVNSPIKLSHQQALTVVFSRSVIALGADFGLPELPPELMPFFFEEEDIPGRFRWVTTSIARFDPLGSWRPDLDLDLVWNTNLTTYDGVPLSLGSLPPRVRLRTPSLTVSLISVGSEEALRLTDDHWDGQVGMEDEFLPEVPPDGSLALRFSDNVELPALRKSLVVYELDSLEKGFSQTAAGSRAKSDIRAIVKQCTTLNETLIDDEGSPVVSDCAVVELSGPLDQGKRYALVLPRGTQYEELSGRLREDVFIDMYGLRKFRIPFQLGVFESFDDRSDVPSGDYYGTISSRRLRMWLVHGLHPDTSLDDLKSAITLIRIPWSWESPAEEEQIPFTLVSKDRGTAQLAAELQPATQYRLVVASRSDVLDGFGLPLTGGDQDFVTSFPHGFVSSHLSYGIKYWETTQGWDARLPIVARGERPPLYITKAWSVNPSSLDEARKIGYLIFRKREPDAPENVGDELGPPDAFSIIPEGQQLRTSYLEMGDVLAPTGLAFVRGPTWWNASEESAGEALFMESDFMVALLISDQPKSSRRMGHVFVTRNTDGEPIKGAEVTLMKFPGHDSPVKELDLVGQSQTNEEGIALLEIPKCMDNCNFVVMVGNGDKLTFFEAYIFDYSFSLSNQPRGALVLDRKLVRPGEDLSIGGFLTQRNGEVVKTWSAKSARLRYGNPDPDAEDDEVEVKLNIDPVYGAFNATISVPENAEFGSYNIQLYDKARRNSGVLYSTSFTVGDPRPPTAELKLFTPTWTRPNSSFEVQVQAISFLGASVEGAEITVAWDIGPETFDEIIITDSDGNGSLTINLMDFEKSIQEYDIGSVFVKAVWIGPTRERISGSRFVRLQKSELSVSLLMSMDIQDIPGVEFGVAAFVDSALSGAISGELVQISLLQVNDSKSGVGDVQLALMEQCTAASGDITAMSLCRMALPSIGHFALRGCIDDSDGKVCATIELGKNFSEWIERPLASHPNLRIVAQGQDQDIFTAVGQFGKEFEVFVDVPFHNTTFLVLFGNTLKREKMVMRFPDPGVHKMAVPLGRECLGGCSVKVLMAIPRQTSLGLDVPTSVGFDPLGTHWVDRRFNIRIPEVSRELTVNVTIAPPNPSESPREEDELVAISPGENATVQVLVAKCQGDPNAGTSFSCNEREPAANAKVLVIAVDKALLQLMPNALVNLSSTLSTDLFSSVETSRLWPSGVLPKDAYARAVDIVLRRLEIDPWLNEVFDVDSLGGTFDMPDQHLLEINADSLTVPPPGLPYGLALLGRVMNQPQPASGPSAGPSLRVRAASESDPAVRLENQFQTTPLFELISTEADGMGRVNFTAPPNLGTFVVRAYAVTDKAQHGGGEAEVIVRLPLSLTPSVPRIVRVGDEFEAGMIVSLFGTRGKPSPVVATLFADPGASKALEFLSDNGTVLPADSASGAEGLGSCDPGSLSCLAPVTAKTLLTDEDGQVEVRFLFSAVQLGETNLTIRADSGGNSDALQISIPVLAQQEEVQLATSFTIRSDKWEERSEEGLKMPDAVPGTGTLGVAAGVGRLPSVLDLSTRILETRTMVPYGSWALANATIPAVLTLYGLEEQRTPNGRDIFSRAISAFEEATLNLEINNLTSEIWGLQWVKPRFSEPSRVDTNLNADAIWTVNRVVGLLNGEVRELNSGLKRLTKLANVWSSVLERQIVEDARSLSKLGSKIDLATLAWTRLALGADWSPPRCPSQDSSFCAEATVIEHLSIERLSRNIRNMSVEARAHLALTWLEADKPGHADVAAVVDSFLSDMRVAGRTAYVSGRPGEAQPAGLQSQALALLVFVESNNSTQLVEKLANYVGRGGLSNGGFSDSAMAIIASLHALSQYDLSSGSIDPNVTLNVSSGSIDILQALFDDPSDPIAESSTPFSALESPPPPLLFETQGTGEVTIVASLEFVPSQLLPFPTYRGIFVERIVQKAGPDNAPSSGPLARVPLATPLVITLQITTPDSLGPVVVRSLMPGGLEPIDPLVDPGAATECTADRLGISYRHWFYPLCPLQETRPSQVTFNYRYLRAGTHAISFQAIASSVGKWMLPPVQAYDEQQPEVMGMSAAGDLFEVCDPSGGDECSEIGADGVRAPSEPPKPCPGNCNGLGLCDLSTGKCLCDSGFSGEDCGSFAEQR